MTGEEIQAEIDKLNDLIEARMRGERAVTHNGVTVTNHSLAELIQAKRELERALTGARFHKMSFSNE